MKEIVSLMSQDPKSKSVQELIAKHYESLRAFYDPNPELYRGLAELYITDERFKAFYEKIARGLAQFTHDAMIYYADTLEGKN